MSSCFSAGTMNSITAESVTDIQNVASMSRAARPRRPERKRSRCDAEPHPHGAETHNPLVRWDALGYNLEMLRGAKWDYVVGSTRAWRSSKPSCTTTWRRVHAPTPAPGSPDRPVWRRRPTPCASRLTTQRASPSSHSRPRVPRRRNASVGHRPAQPSAHVGISLLPQFRGQDLASSPTLLCRYGLWFAPTPAAGGDAGDNAPMPRAAASDSSGTASCVGSMGQRAVHA